MLSYQNSKNTQFVVFKFNCKFFFISFNIKKLNRTDKNGLEADYPFYLGFGYESKQFRICNLLSF